MATTVIRKDNGRLSESAFRLLSMLVDGKQITLTSTTLRLGMVQEVLGSGFAVLEDNVLKSAQNIDIVLIE